jgi:hypothetical protein
MQLLFSLLERRRYLLFFPLDDLVQLVCKLAIIQRLAILAMLVMGFLTWILLRSRDLTKRLFSLTSRFRKAVKFQYYRLLDGIQEFIRLNPNEFLKPPPDIRKNG